MTSAALTGVCTLLSAILVLLLDCGDGAAMTQWLRCWTLPVVDLDFTGWVLTSIRHKLLPFTR